MRTKVSSHVLNLNYLYKNEKILISLPLFIQQLKIKQSTCYREQQTVFVLFHAYPLKKKSLNL